MVPLRSAGRTAYRGREPAQSRQPQHDRPSRGSDKPARVATIFIHNGAPQALVGCLERVAELSRLRHRALPKILREGVHHRLVDVFDDAVILRCDVEVDVG
jgi:hypothetical protein